VYVEELESNHEYISHKNLDVRGAVSDLVT
jgi:hypothetical protein